MFIYNIENEENQKENSFWISLSDLMTGLMLVFIIISIVFIVIAKSNLSELEKKKTELEHKTAELEKKNKEIEELLEELSSRMKNVIIIFEKELNKNSINVKYNNDKGTIEISNSILFDFQSNEIKEDGKIFLKYFTTILDREVFSNKKYLDIVKYLHIEGYSSSSGNFEFNMELSQRRAFAIWKYINTLDLKNKNIMLKKLNLVGRGDIDADKIKDNKADRKVQFRFEFNDDYYQLIDILQKNKQQIR